MQFCTKYRYEKDLEPGGGERITEQAGYIEPKIQIETMMMAGQRLAGFRQEYFDIGKGAQDAPVDDLRKQYYDPIEAMETGKALAIRMKEREAKKKAAMAAKAAQQAAQSEKSGESATDVKKAAYAAAEKAPD